MLMLSLAIAASLTACQKDPAPAAAEPVAQAAAPALTLDESKLPPYNQFKASDLDASKNACADFGGFVNGKWLATNAIPGDRTSWGAFEMLGERSIAVQQQLAEQAAAMKVPRASRRSSVISGPQAWMRPRSMRRASPR